jgi:hypothetical protein
METAEELLSMAQHTREGTFWESTQRSPMRPHIKHGSLRSAAIRLAGLRTCGLGEFLVDMHQFKGWAMAPLV